MKWILPLLVALNTGFVSAQLNMNLLGNLDYQALHDAQLNDVWGYTDETGKEYALVGATKGTSVVDISDPTNPVEVFWEPGMESIWRDLKTWGDYAYITTEAQNGLLIIDLSPLPSSTALSATYYNGEGTDTLKSAHNLFIDENGYCYIFGSNIDGGGVLILDVFTDPLNPTIVGEFTDWYVHDGYVRNDTMYLAHINDGFFSIVDVTDKQNPIVLGTKTTPSNFSHNIWLSDDGDFVFTTDEVSGAYLGAYDITDPANIVEVDRVQSSPGALVIPHNTHVKGNFLVTSYYSDGVTIHDATYPYNLVEVGHYDTYPLQTTGYDGCWGAYPFLPSGHVLATDRETGLFVLGTTYQQAAYLEGVVTDAMTSNPINNVEVTIQGSPHPNYSDLSGFYATGFVDDGTVQVTYHKVGYYPETDNVIITEGVITTHDVQLIPIPPYNLTIEVRDAVTDNPIPDAFIRIENEFLTHEGSSNGIGVEDMTLYYEGEYLVTVGIWGYVTSCENRVIDENTGSIIVYLNKGYYDDFSFGFGWINTGDALTGHWERGIPFGTEENANPDRDAPWDCGGHAYVTGNLNEYGFTLDDVENGEVKLFSPIMDLTTYGDPHVNYWLWFYDRYGPSFPDDSLRVYLLNGSQTVLIDTLGFAEFYDQWIPRSLRVSDFIPITSTMQIMIQTSDYEPNWNVVEAGFDHFFISEYNTTDVPEVAELNELEVFPNPFETSVTIRNAPIGSNFELIDLNGRVMTSGMVETAEFVLDMTSLSQGIYVFKTAGAFKRLVKN